MNVYESHVFLLHFQLDEYYLGRYDQETYQTEIQAVKDQDTRWPMQGLVCCQDSQTDAVVDFWQDRNLTMLSASIDPGNQEIKVCNVFRCQTRHS